MILIATQCFPPVFGGIENYMAGLAGAVAAEGRALAVLADGADDGGDAARPYLVSRFSGPKPLRRLVKRRAAARLLDAGAERIFVDSYKSVAALPLRPGVRLVALAHGMEFPSAPRPEKAARIRRLLSRADVVLANSRYTADLARPYLADPARLRVATPPIPPQPEPSAEAAARLAERVGDAAPLVAVLARLEPRKGVDHLIRALVALSGAHPAARLAVAGGGGDRPRLEALAAELGLAERVVFLGRVSEDEKAALFARADLFAMPARREGDSVEGFGIVYLEAAWHGAPSLAGREGGAADAVREGETGLLCDGADPASVADALGRLLSDRAALGRMGEAARAWARAQLWSARIGDYLSA